MEWENVFAGPVKDITTAPMVVRGLIVFLYGMILIRFGAHRIFGKMGAFDIVLSVIVGSNLSRAVTGNTPLVPALITTTVLVLVHLALSHASIHWPWLSWLIKGRPFLLVKAGKADDRAMRRHGISRGDLMQALHEKGIDSLSQCESAWLERSGDISIVKKQG